MGRDCVAFYPRQCKVMFQSTRPRGARPCHRAARFWRGSFNPRAHVGRDALLYPHIVYVEVSIHAPTWGATRRPTPQPAEADVSIHAPTWGATIFALSLAKACLFQSTRPRGARRQVHMLISFKYSFNPRAHVGRDRQPRPASAWP